ncbi:MAG: hypothetical protein WA663_00460 [Candidatus Acidiferrales bacterium]
MDSLLLGTCHPLLVDNPPEVCPTNMQGEAQKFLNQLWIADLIHKFDPAAVFDESRVALCSLAMVHEKMDFFRATYVPPVPWVFMDVPVHYRDVATLRGIPNSDDHVYRNFFREDYWLRTILCIVNAVGLQRVAIICGYEHVQAGRLEQRLRVYGNVEVHDVTQQPWFNLEWSRLPHDKSIVDGWIEEHKKKNLRLGLKFARK